MNSKVDKFLSRADKWQEEMKQLRLISLDCGLTENLKWGKPCYSFQDNNIVIIQPFKESCALMFLKGVLLEDPRITGAKQFIDLFKKYYGRTPHQYLTASKVKSKKNKVQEL